MDTKKLNSGLTNFYLFILGQFVSQFGSRLTGLGLILWSYKQNGSVLSLSLLSVAYLLPEVFLSFISGSVSDRWNKKKLLLFSDLASALFSFAVLLMLITDTLRIPYLYLVQFMMGVMDSFQNPASEVAVSMLVSKEDYIKTSGVRTFFYSFTGVFAPVAATSLFAFCGIEVIIMIDLGTFLFAFITLAAWVKLPHRVPSDDKKEKLSQQCIFGIRYLINKKDVFSLILFMGFVNLIAAVYNTNMAPMVLSRNGNDDVQLGIVSSTISLAGLAGSVLVTRVKWKKKRATLILNIMTYSFLVCNGLLGLGRNYYVWIFAVFAGNLLIPVLTANVEYIMRTKVPLEVQGRVFAARNTLQYASIPVGNLIAGVLADKVFVPFMSKPSSFQGFWQAIVGDGKGGGLALMYLVIALVGAGGCFVFRRNRHMMSLNEE